MQPCHLTISEPVIDEVLVSVTLYPRRKGKLSCSILCDSIEEARDLRRLVHARAQQTRPGSWYVYEGAIARALRRMDASLDYSPRSFEVALRKE